ncbi:MAG: polyketide cyclase [Rikenellaceae bacterium]
MRVESKQQQVFRPAAQIYSVVSKFSNFSPILADKVEQWEADDDTCSFIAKGYRVSLAIIEREQDKLIKIGEGEGGTPFPFSFWLQLKEVGANDTRMRIVLDAQLNMMMKMMIGGKLQKAVDQIAQQLADGFNGKMPENM